MELPAFFLVILIVVAPISFGLASWTSPGTGLWHFFHHLTRYQVHLMGFGFWNIGTEVTDTLAWRFIKLSLIVYGVCVFLFYILWTSDARWFWTPRRKAKFDKKYEEWKKKNFGG